MYCILPLYLRQNEIKRGALTLDFVLICLISSQRHFFSSKSPIEIVENGSKKTERYNKRYRHTWLALVSKCGVMIDVPFLNGFRCALLKRHRCSLFDFLLEVCGSDRGTSVVFRGSFHGLPWKSAGFHGKGHGFPLYMALPRQVPRLWPWDCLLYTSPSPRD